jgi:hypothetical protein
MSETDDEQSIERTPEDQLRFERDMNRIELERVKAELKACQDDILESGTRVPATAFVTEACNNYERVKQERDDARQGKLALADRVLKAERQHDELLAVLKVTAEAAMTHASSLSLSVQNYLRVTIKTHATQSPKPKGGRNE